VVVETLPATARVDLAQYTTLSELVSAASVAPGRYSAGSITLDYTGAEIFVEDAGVPTVAIALDDTGTPLTTVTLDLILDIDRPLIIVAGTPTLIELDFDLAASHTVDLVPDPIEVTAEPFIVAEVDPVDSRELRLRGPLVRVSEADDAYRIALRPFYHRTGRHGGATVHVDDETVYEIDGQNYSGDAGLTALAALPVATPTVAQGEFDVPTREFTADTVLAGSSVPGNAADMVAGHVLARTGSTLTVMGVVLDRNDGAAHFRPQIQVEVGPDTRVARRGVDQLLGDEVISVGQRLLLLGQLDVNDSMTALVLDADPGFALMAVTAINGTVVTYSEGELRMDLVSFDGRPAALFDYSGTGLSGTDDADPDDYQVDTGVLPLDGLEIDAPVVSLGFVGEFGQAPPDFAALSVIDFSTGQAVLGADWTEAGTLAPFATLNPTSFSLDLSNPDFGRRHHLVRGGVATDLSTLPASPLVVPAADRPGRYAIAMDNSVSVYSEFADFEEDLESRLNGSNTVVALFAEGGYDADTNTLTVIRIALRMEGGD
jgi:hypothetical protein